jgi:hypothetical protein
VGVIKNPVITAGVFPASRAAPTAGVIFTANEGAAPTAVTAPVFGVTNRSVRSCGATPAITAAPVAGDTDMFTVVAGVCPTILIAPVAGVTI